MQYTSYVVEANNPLIVNESIELIDVLECFCWITSTVDFGAYPTEKAAQNIVDIKPSLLRDK